jgi:ABC-2 type transport system ATP-binding protein
LIRAEDLSVHFRQGIKRRVLKALDHLDLEIREGDFFALLGQNGAGKSTAMYCLLGLLRPTQGRVTVFGQSPELGSSLYKQIAYLPEEPHYHDYLTVEEAVRYYGALYGKAVSATRVGELLERLRLTEFRRLPLRKCSKGMKQKVGIAQCLLNDTRVLFLDEPMRGLDPLAVKDFRDVLVEMNKKGATVVMNSHILSEVEMVANRAAIIDRGRVLAQDELTNLLRVDVGAYAVEMQDHPQLPSFFTRESAKDGAAHGTVPVERLYDLIDFARTNHLRLMSFALRKASLEESFFAILSSRSPDA